MVVRLRCARIRATPRSNALLLVKLRVQPCCRRVLFSSCLLPSQTRMVACYRRLLPLVAEPRGGLGIPRSKVRSRHGPNQPVCPQTGSKVAVRGSAPTARMLLRTPLAFVTPSNRPDEVRAYASVGMHAEGTLDVASAASAPACENVRARWPCPQRDRLSIQEARRARRRACDP